MSNEERNFYRKILKVFTIVITFVILYLMASAMIDLIQSDMPITFLSLFRALGSFSMLAIFYVILWIAPKKTDHV